MGRVRDGWRVWRLDRPGPFFRIVLISALLAAVTLRAATVFGAVPFPYLNPKVHPTAHAQYVVLIVLDGARPDYFGVAPLPHLDALRRAGSQFGGAFDGILESETPAGHATIATGSTPRHNGILGFAWAQNDKEYSLFDPEVVRAGTMEHIMANAHAPTIAGLYKAVHPLDNVVAVSGHKYYAADPLGGPQADAILYFRGLLNGGYGPTAIPGHVPPAGVLETPGLTLKTQHLPDGTDDHLATELALAAFAKMQPHVLMINYPEFDWPLGHVDGGNVARAKVINLMQKFDQDLGQIIDTYRHAHLLRRTLFVITADHGMAPVTRWIPSTVLSNALKEAGTSSPYRSDSTGDFVWLHDPSKAREVALDVLRQNDPGIQSAYYLDWTHGPHYVLAGGKLVSPAVDAANQYMLSTLIDGHQPQLVLLATRNASFAPVKNGWKADHGGAGWHSQQIPLVLAGPGIRPGFVSNNPAQLVDIAPTILSDMQVPPTGMEGHVLTEALLQPSAADSSARLGEIKQLQPFVAGMLAQDRFEMGKH